MGGRSGATGALVTVARAASFRRVNLAFVGYSISEHATWLAVAVFALQRGGPSTVGLVAVAQLVPGVVLTPFSSFAGDRFRPARALAAGYAVQCVAMAATAVAMASGRELTAYAAGAVAATAISFIRPVMGALLPTLTNAPSELVAANVVAGVIEQVGLFVGPLVAGVLLAVGSPELVFTVGAVLTGAGALGVVRIGPDAGADRAVVPTGRQALGELLAGFGALRRAPVLRLLLAFVAGAGLVRGVGDVIFVTFADERLRAGGGASGYLAVVYGIGGLIAASTTTQLARSRRPALRFALAGLAAATGLLALAAASSYLSSGVAFALLGAGDALVMIAAVVTVQRVAPTDVLGRLFGIVEGTQMGCIAIGSWLVSVLTTTTSLGGALGSMAAVVGVIVVGAAAVLRRHGDVVPPVDDAVVERLLVDPVFASLPAPVIERLARAATWVEVPAGARIVTEGEVGDHYFCIVDGSVEVTIGGSYVRTLGPDESFGEIALLRDVPRTATATATTDVTLVAVGRDEFLTSVTGHPRSFSTASGVADRWLAAG